MPAKPVAQSLVLWMLVAIGLPHAPVLAAPPPTTIVLFPRMLTQDEDIRALVDIRKKLRSDTPFEVITYDPNSAAVKRASAEAGHPEWLTDPMNADPERLALTRALGAGFYAVISHADGRGKMDVRLGEVAPAARVWSGGNEKSGDAVKFLQQQVASALAQTRGSQPARAGAVSPERPVTSPERPVTSPERPVTSPERPVTSPERPVTSPAPALPSVPPVLLPASPVLPSKPSVPTVTRPAPTPIVEDLSSVRKTLSDGDSALAIGSFVEAIADYRDAVNGAPLSVVPRLKLAQAYLQSDLRDRALNEAQRALQIAPGDPSVVQFLTQLDAETGSTDGAVARFQALADQNPQDAAAHLELGDALWNNSSTTQAESEYKLAQSLAASQPQTAQSAASHLARLYAAQSRYDDSLAALRDAGAGGYALALTIVQGRADTLRSTLDAAQGTFDAGKSTHESFYKTVTDAAAQSQSLADFVVKVTPPPAFKVSHLHRVLATHLLAQQAAVLVSYVETADAALSEQSARLDKEAQTEMLTAHAAEQVLGLWNAAHAEARN